MQPLSDRQFRLSRPAPKFLILEVIGLGRAEPIFIAASRSQDVTRSARRNPARVNFPRGLLGTPQRCALVSTAPSGTSPCVT
jgi:hypothetical protein